MTIEHLQACDPLGTGIQTDAAAALKRKLEKLNLTHVRALFASKKLAFSTSLIMAVWGFIGMFCSSRPRFATNHTRPRISFVQRFPSLYSSHAWTKVPRRQHVHHISELADHCCTWRTWCPSWWSSGRNPPFWSKGSSGSFYHLDRRVPLCHHDS